MTASITQFAALNPPTATGGQLDDNFLLVGEQAPIPCAASGSNTVALTQQANVVTISAYTNNMQVSFIVPTTNTGPVQGGIGTIGNLNVYKDTPSGPVLLSGGEQVAGCAVTWMYDAALNNGVGGWHLFANTAPASLISAGGASLTNFFSGTASLSFSAAAANSSEDKTFSVSGVGAANIPQVGDFMQVVPPSLAAPGIAFQGMVVAAGSLTASTSQATINIRALNSNSATVTPPAGNYRYLATRAVP